MDYDEGRNLAVADAYKSVRGKLLATYKPGAPLVVLLPGGMGSQLDRSPTAFAGDPIAFDNYTVPWLSLDLLFRASGLTLGIDAQGEDTDGFIIVPDGPVEFALIPAYDGAQAYFQDVGYNYCVFGYDWRRPIQEAAVNLQAFLSDLQADVQAQFAEDPLPRTTLMCHSQGGLVAKLFMHLPNTPGAAIQRLITVATPFYGTADTTPAFYFEGHPILNILYGAARVAPIMSSAPGPYALMPIDHATWLARGAMLGVAAYPVVDENRAPIDPYDVANMARYPSWVSQDYVSDALLVRSTIDLDLPADLLAKVFHLRAESTATLGRFRWAPLPAGYVAGQSASNWGVDPMAPNGGTIAGDGTVPAYSAGLAQNLDKAKTITIATLQQHSDLAENTRFLTAARAIAETGVAPDPAVLAALPDTAYNAAARPKAATSDIRGLLGDVAAGRADANDPRLAQADMARGLIRELIK